MPTVERGCLSIADITGYTKYLAGVELDHSQDVLADLMATIVSQMRGQLHLAKLEGDAIFCYDHDGESDGSMLLAMVESCYFAFAKRLRTIIRHTTCECNACRLIPQLNLKFMTHHGEYLIHEVAGSRELVGRDVILAHRLLKNTVSQRLKLRGYALFTQPCLQRFALDPAALGMIEHVEAFEDVGEVTGYVLDLETRWEQEQQRRAVYIAPGEGLTVAEFEVLAPPAIVWDYLTNPVKRPLWQAGALRVEEETPLGIRGVGTTNHCVHGDYTIEEEILDWKPFHYMTEHFIGPLGAAQFTIELTPVDDSTTGVTFRMLPDGGPAVLETVRAMLPQLQERFDVNARNLAALVARAQADARERSTSLSS